MEALGVVLWDVREAETASASEGTLSGRAVIFRFIKIDEGERMF